MQQNIDLDHLFLRRFTGRPGGFEAFDGCGVAGHGKRAGVFLFPGLPGEVMVAGIAMQIFDPTLQALDKGAPGFFVITLETLEFPGCVYTRRTATWTF